MSKYYKAEDVIGLYEKYHHKLAVKVTEFGNALKDLPTIEISEDAISREWLINYCKGKADYYRKRLQSCEEHKDESYHDLSNRIEHYKDEIAVYEHFIEEINDAPSVIPSRYER